MCCRDFFLSLPLFAPVCVCLRLFFPPPPPRHRPVICLHLLERTSKDLLCRKEWGPGLGVFFFLPSPLLSFMCVWLVYREVGWCSNFFSAHDVLR
ncbi:hypothetical protein BS50DRAFT_405496 [Corynespora cassiicola Philippines]|uniref:Uncharacterized protein n=1 Tax=Corynespora cassiicola Philippines TaxID=1448308 RepID=A0A2T2NKU1_CORCC|nr:hypothetical protein BS50DRAFT_405496 [Corynespora cassiicola Philippines]